MAKLFYTNIDLKGNQLQNPVLHSLTEAPQNPQEGQLYYNSSDKLTYQYIGVIDGTPTWIPVTGSVNPLGENRNQVVTSVSTTNGRATLGTTGVQELVLGVALPTAGTSASQSLQQVMEAVDAAIDNRVVRNGQWTAEGRLLVTNGTKGASETAYSIQGTSLHAGAEYEVPTSKVIADYIGSLAGGLDYKGTLNWKADPETETVKHELPTTGVKNGDVWVVAENTDSTHHYTGSENAEVGDIYVASVSNGVVTWDKIPLDFAVEDGHKLLAPVDGMQTIAKIDGHDITLGIQAITINPNIGGEPNGNVIDGISFDGNNVGTISKKYALQNVSVSGEGGVIYDVHLADDNVTVEVLQHSLQVNQPENLQYVAGLQQGSDGKVFITAGQFDQVINATTGANKTKAPSTEAVKNYVDESVQGLDVLPGLDIVTKDAATGEVCLQTVVKEENGLIGLGGNTITLQKVASTGQAEDVKVPAGSGIADSETTVLGGLQGLQSALNNLGDHVVNSIQGIYGDITLGGGLEMDTANNSKILKAKAKSGDYVTVGSEGIHLDPNQIDSGFDDQGADTDLATVGTVKAAINDLDVAENALSTGSNTSIDIYAIYENDGEIGIQNTAGNTNVKSWNFDGTYDASTNKIALQGTVANAISTLDGSADIAVYDSSYSPSVTGQVKLDLFGVVEENGVISASQNALQSLYFTKGISDTNPIATKDDVTSLGNDLIEAKVLQNPSLSGQSNVCTWEITVSGMPTGDKWDENTVVEVREIGQNSNAVVETDVVYDTLANKILIQFNGSGYSENVFKAVILTKKRYTVQNVQNA